MALILAVNPGGTQSGTLARVARELQEHELIGADSCAVALAALDDHKPQQAASRRTTWRSPLECQAALRCATKRPALG